jgi:hypothetical protein
VTVTVPFVVGCNWQKYLIVPGALPDRSGTGR